jgi:hypothetical protein
MQEPLLDLERFARFCAGNAAHLGLTRYPESAISYLRRKGLLRPVEILNRRPFFSPFQIWLVANAGLDPKRRKGFLEAHAEEFHRVVRLLTSIQDFYLPEVRSDLRSARFISQGPSFVSRGGLGFRTLSTYHLSSLRDRRRELIREGLFQPAALVADSGLSLDRIAHWKWSIEVEADRRDPLEKWEFLVRAMPFEKREELKGDARLVVWYREMSEMLTLCLRDCGDSRGSAIPSDWVDPAFDRDASDRNEWKLRFYGRSALAKPYELLEFLANEFHLNPRPKALIFTEGEEWRAVRCIFLRLGLNPDLMGVEMRSIAGEGNFTKDKWRFFLEYMHEKQVFVFFALDREGKTVDQQRSLERAVRHFRASGLDKVLPQDRVVIWDGSFEEANFSDREIAIALSLQGTRVSRQQIAAQRRSGARRKGLIAHLVGLVDARLDKGQLAADLAERMKLLGFEAPEDARMTQLERFVQSAALLILRNHPPTTIDSIERNRQTRLLG